ncbi:AI-2E family transporter [Trichloromonas sp.]|uniref:AI-2E family transporter n=1 Tax=Trichloromonas sp. TaxID=3069249 RepID=UPI003D8169E7
MNRKIWITAGFVFSLLLLTGFFYLIRSIFIPFLLALILAYFLDPAVDWLEERRFSRTLAVSLVFAAFLTIAGALLGFLVPTVKSELSFLHKALPGYVDNLYNMVPSSVFEWFGIAEERDLQSLINRALAGAKNLSFDLVNQVAVFLSHAFTSTLRFFLALLGYFIIPIYLFYLLRDFDRMKDAMVDLVPFRWRQSTISVGLEINDVLGGFIRGQLTVCMLLAVFYSLGLLIIGIDMPFVIGIMSGAAFIIPYLGTLLGIVVAGTMAVVKYHDLLHPVLVVGLFGLVQALEGAVITPRIVGDRVGLHPLGTIIAVLVGGELFGFLGLLLAVPVAASVNVLFRHALNRYHRSEFRGCAPELEEEPNA